MVGIRHLEFYFFIFGHVTVIEFQICICIQNFIKIGDFSLRWLWRCHNFHDGGSQYFRGPIIGSIKSSRRTSYRSSVKTIAVKLRSFWENRVLVYAVWRQTDRQTNVRTDGPARRIKPQARYRERRIKNHDVIKKMSTLRHVSSCVTWHMSVV